MDAWTALSGHSGGRRPSNLDEFVIVRGELQLVAPKLPDSNVNCVGSANVNVVTTSQDAPVVRQPQISSNDEAKRATYRVEDLEACVVEEGTCEADSCAGHDASAGSVRFVRVQLNRKGTPLLYGEVISLLPSMTAGGRTIRLLLTQVFAGDCGIIIPFNAFFWECKPVSQETLDCTVYEFVAIEAPQMGSKEADGTAFNGQLDRHRGTHGAVQFMTPSPPRKEANLIAPVNALETDLSAYRSIGSFFHGAPRQQTDAMLVLLGTQIPARMAMRGDPRLPLWVSSAGYDVAWMHFRLDDFPSYYCFKEYTNQDELAVSSASPHDLTQENVTGKDPYESDAFHQADSINVQPTSHTQQRHLAEASNAVPAETTPQSLLERQCVEMSEFAMALEHKVTASSVASGQASTHCTTPLAGRPEHSRTNRSEVRRLMQLQRVAGALHGNVGINTAPASLAGSSPGSSWNPPSSALGSSQRGSAAPSSAASSRAVALEQEIKAFGNRFLLRRGGCGSQKETSMLARQCTQLRNSVSPMAHGVEPPVKSATFVSGADTVGSACVAAVRKSRNEVRRLMQLDRVENGLHKALHRSTNASVGTRASALAAGSRSPPPSWKPPSSTPGFSQSPGWTPGASSAASSTRGPVLDKKIANFRNRFLLHRNGFPSSTQQGRATSARNMKE